jgi:epoxyqueuosine reductase QueG
LNHQIMHRLTEMLQKGGKSAVAPILTEEYDAFRSSKYTFSSTWSERHVAYAAGLGHFGLNGYLITPLGVNVRIGSMVTNLPLEPTPRRKDSHRAPCLENGGEGCGICIGKCPVRAISGNVYDKSRCYEKRRMIRQRFLEDYSREERMVPVQIVKSGKRKYGYSLGCALCQCGVPCEGLDPYDVQERDT